MHSFALRGRTSFFENRKLEIKENYNSYNEIDDRKVVSKRGGNSKFAIRNSQFPKFLAKRIRAHDGCLGIGRL